jgi:hypothetical protein
MGDWRLSEGWKSVPDSRTPDPPDGEPGPWRDRTGGVMHGVYERRIGGVESGRPAHVEGIAAWYGSRLWSWSGPEMPRFRDRRVSPWNPILAQGLRCEGVEMTPYRTPSWCEEWIAEALLRDLKPYGRFALPYKSAMDWFAEAGRAGLVYRATRDDPADGDDGERRLYIVAAVARTYGEVFDLDALIADYQDALPEDLAAPQIDALQRHRDQSMGLLYVLADDADERFWAAPRAVRGLTLGYPPSSTAARILAEAEPTSGTPRTRRFLEPAAHPQPTGLANGTGRTNGQQMIRVPECRHPGRPHARVADMTPATFATIVRWIDRSWPVDMPRGLYPDSALELERSGYLIAIAYRAYVSGDPLLRVPIGDDPAAEGELHRYVCCLLRGMSKDPREIHLDAVYARKMVWS